MQVVGECGQPLLAHRGHGDGDREGKQAGQQHQEDVARPDPAGVEQVKRRGVDEQVAHLHPGEVGTGEAGALAVQDLLEAGVETHADDQPCILGLEQQQGGVLRGPGGLDRQRPDTEPLELLGVEPPPGVDPDDDVAGRPQRLGGGAFGDAFATAAATRLYDEQLAGHSVALVSLPGADQRIIDGLVGQVEHAGGTLEGTYALQRALVDPGEKSLVDTLGSQLMTQLDSGAADENAPTYERLGQLLGTAIATQQKDGAGVDDNTASIRQSLAGADLVVSPEEEVGLAPLVLVVLGNNIDDNILGGLVAGLESRALGVVVAGDTRSGGNGDVAALRKQPEAGKVTTVDGVELAVGQVTATLALGRSLTDKGGSFGASGSDGAVPLR